MNKIRARRWLNAPVDLIVDRFKAHALLNEEEILEFRDTLLAPALNKLTIMAWQLAENDLRDLFGEAINNLHRIYCMSSELKFPDKPLIWQETMLRVYVLGALAVANTTYWPVNPLVSKNPCDDSYWQKRYWARHTLTMLARENRLKANSLCVVAVDFLSANPHFLAHFGLEPESGKEAPLMRSASSTFFSA